MVAIGVAWIGDARVPMNEDSGRLFDEFARVFGDAAGVAQGIQREAEAFFRSQAERLTGDMNLVRREDFEVVKDMVAALRGENERLAARVAALEAQLAESAAAATKPRNARKPGGGEPPAGATPSKAG